MRIFARRAYLESAWAQDVRIAVETGEIAHIEVGASPKAGDVRVDTLLPALCNLHSHSFQRAMAGMSEFRAQGRESFWTWRALMYRFLDHLRPEQIGAIASLAFMEMQKAGYAAVGEFHYLHNALNGQRYDDPAEVSAHIMQAAQMTGIGLTHLPVLYSYGDVGQEPLAGGQLRFGNTLDQFLDLVARCEALAQAHNSDTLIGVAPHSLRATSPADLSTLLQIRAQGPMHMHIAEQVKEVEDVQAAMGARPVEWLMANADVDARWCLIHATHMTATETAQMAQSGAVVGLCPVTESSLGDGIFEGVEYLAHKGRFGIGTDSNVNISALEELRTFEYGQRLKHQQRNVICGADGSTGATLYEHALSGGAQALGRHSGALKVGNLADMMAIESNDLRLCGLSKAHLLDGLIFAANERVITDVWSAGRHCVQGGHHIAEATIVPAYRDAIATLVDVI